MGPRLVSQNWESCDQTNGRKYPKCTKPALNMTLGSILKCYNLPEFKSVQAIKSWKKNWQGLTIQTVIAVLWKVKSSFKMGWSIYHQATQINDIITHEPFSAPLLYCYVCDDCPNSLSPLRHMAACPDSSHVSCITTLTTFAEFKSKLLLPLSLSLLLSLPLSLSCLDSSHVSCITTFAEFKRKCQSASSPRGTNCWSVTWEVCTMQPEKSTCPKKLSAQKALRSQSHAFLHLLIKLHFVLNATPYFVLDEVIKSVDFEPHQLAFLHPPYIHGPIFLQQFQGRSNFYTSSTVPGFFWPNFYTFSIFSNQSGMLKGASACKKRTLQ